MNFITSSVAVMTLLASVHFGGTNIKSMSQDNPAYAAEAVPLVMNVEPKEVISTTTVEDVVRDYFKDIPVLAKVAKCESHFRQVDANGNVLRGIQNQFDVGVMQINEKYHLERSEKMDINIHTLGGNLEYARELYNESGTAPWSSSKVCWSAM